LTNDIQLPQDYQSKFFKFNSGKNEYDGKTIEYLYSIIDEQQLKLKLFTAAKKIKFDSAPNLTFEKEFPIGAPELLEYITNYSYRHHWVDGVDKFEYNEHEVTRLGTEHVCVINGKHLDFVTVTKEVNPDQLVYGEESSSLPPVDKLYQFFIISPISADSCKLEIEIYWKAKSPLKKLVLFFFAKNFIRKNTIKGIAALLTFVKSKKTEGAII